MSLLTECFSMYSDMSTRTIARSSSKRNSASARATSVLPTPVGPRKRNDPIGRLGSERPARLRRIAAQTGVAERVEFLGFVDDPTSLYDRADALLVLSRHEGLPLVLLEGMASGLPVIRRTFSFSGSWRSRPASKAMPPPPGLRASDWGIARISNSGCSKPCLRRGLGMICMLGQRSWLRR